jgi:hypothetical protein
VFPVGMSRIDKQGSIGAARSDDDDGPAFV